MKRKRFVKLLMAHYYQRNEAASIADCFNLCGVPYDDAWQEIKAAAIVRAIRVDFQISTKAISDTLYKLTKTMQDFGRAVLEGLHANCPYITPAEAKEAFGLPATGEYAVLAPDKQEMGAKS